MTCVYLSLFSKTSRLQFIFLIFTNMSICQGTLILSHSDKKTKSKQKQCEDVMLETVIFIKTAIEPKICSLLVWCQQKTWICAFLCISQCGPGKVNVAPDTHCDPECPVVALWPAQLRQTDRQTDRERERDRRIICLLPRTACSIMSVMKKKKKRRALAWC